MPHYQGQLQKGERSSASFQAATALLSNAWVEALLRCSQMAVLKGAVLEVQVAQLLPADSVHRHEESW